MTMQKSCSFLLRMKIYISMEMSQKCGNGIKSSRNATSRKSG